eukprot:363637-Chlamydomonas_euryale.AAC.16
MPRMHFWIAKSSLDVEQVDFTAVQYSFCISHACQFLLFVLSPLCGMHNAAAAFLPLLRTGLGCTTKPAPSGSGACPDASTAGGGWCAELSDETEAPLWADLLVCLHLALLESADEHESVLRAAPHADCGQLAADAEEQHSQLMLDLLSLVGEGLSAHVAAVFKVHDKKDSSCPTTSQAVDAWLQLAVACVRIVLLSGTYLTSQPLLARMLCERANSDKDDSTMGYADVSDEQAAASAMLAFARAKTTNAITLPQVRR